MFHRRLGSNTYESSHHQSWFRFCLVNSGFLQGSPGKEKHINQPNHEGLARFSEFLRLEKNKRYLTFFNREFCRSQMLGGFPIFVFINWQLLSCMTRTYWRLNSNLCLTTQWKGVCSGTYRKLQPVVGGVSNQRLNFGSLSGLRASSVCCDRSGFLEGGPPVRWLSFQRQTSWVEWGLSFQSLLTEKKKTATPEINYTLCIRGLLL